MSRFAARCQRGHDLVEFTDPAVFEAHMIGQHKARKPFPGGATPATCDRKAAGWTDGTPDKPYAWKAPSRTPGGIERVSERIDAREYRWPGGTYFFPVGPRQGLGVVAGEVA